jgi:lipopolysaccharide transport system ATP-binding protein
MASTPLVQVEHIAKSFRIPDVRRDTVREHVFSLMRSRRFERLDALRDVSFEVRRGETVGVMGPNGCGKSTLLKIVCGVYPPDRGRVVLNAALTPILELGVGWHPELDAVDNVLLIGSVMGLPLRDVRRSMDEILAFAEVERFAGLKLKHYSSGMAARLAYAVAFRAVRDVLVLDEIFAVGDAGFKARCEQRFAELRASGHTIIIVSHDPRTVSTFCDRALLMNGGRVVREGSGPAIAEQYLAALTAATV